MSNQATARIYRTGEVTDYMSISTVEHGGTWRVYKGPVENAIDCIRIREALSGFHLEYRTWNEGVGKYYPYVNSEDDSADSYAGLAGKAIQRVNIVAYDDNNNKVDTGIVVMYRARVDGSWLPWVSNANAASMQSVQEKYGGMDDLDTTSGYAGISGKNMDGFQIRVFVEQPIGGNTGGTSDPSQGNFNGSEVNLTLSYMKDNESNWVGFNKSAFPGDYIDGIKIQTSASDEFYLSYKTKAAGSGNYFSAVLSTDSSQYAGLPGRHIQRLSISAYDKGGNKLDKGVVIMYRAYVDSKWLPWVSNAAPDWMENVWNTFDLPGTLDTSSGYAGVDGKDIKGVEIRAFVGNNINGSLTGLLGMEISPTSSRYLVGNQWHSFHKKVEASRIDGIEIKTDPNKSYYLSYQTQNEGRSTFYPAVTSLENDYAGYPNKAVQTVGIRVFTNDGVKVDSGVVVMLRTKTGGRWLPWVSNADPEWMRSVQRKYGLNLTLDTSSYEAGIQGQNIEGIEVRIFEETGIYAGAQTPAGKTKIIKNVPFIYQMNDWPTGCESVSTVMALNHAGNSMTVDTFINNYLDKQPYPFDPDETFGGDPRDDSGFGCYAPAIKKALDKALANTDYYATQLSNLSMMSLCSQYIDNDIPVIMWATMEMQEAYIGRRWTYNGKVIQWIAPEHCLLLVGYTDTHYIFNDPRQHKNTYYGKSVVENAYEAFSRQAIVIQKKNNTYQDLTRIDREVLLNTYYYAQNHNNNLQLPEGLISTNLNDFTILSCLQLIFVYYYNRADYEKTDLIYNEMIFLRKLNPSYETYYAAFLDDNGEFDLGYTMYAPNRKTTVFRINDGTYFTKDTINQMHTNDDILAFLANFLPGIGSGLSLLMTTMGTLEQDFGIGLSDDIVDGISGKAGEEIINYLINKWDAPQVLAKTFNLLSIVHDFYEIGSGDHDTYIRDGITIQEDDAYMNIWIVYDLGVEYHQFRFYFRNGYPYVTNLPQYIVRNDQDAYGHARAQVQEFLDKGYVESEQHNPRGPYWPSDLLD